MKYLKFLIFTSLFMTLLSCGGDDDICESGEGTPRLKVAFKKADKATTLDSLQILVDYGSGKKVDLGWNTKVASTLIPLRVDDSPYTEIYFKTSTKGTESKVKVSYTTKSTYVSPGCGIKKTYENLSPELLIANPVLNVELDENQIENENKTNLYLIF